MSPERLSYTINETVQLTGLSYTTVWKHIRLKTLPSRKIGNKRIVLAEDLKAFLTNGAAA